MLKKYLICTCMKIEENFNKIYYPEDNNDINSNINTSPNNNEVTNTQNEKDEKENEEIMKKIKMYKLKIKELQNKIELIIKVNNINELEGDLEIKKNYLKHLTSENNALKNVKLLQDKGLSEINNNTSRRQELFTIIEKTKKIKEEIKIKKDYLKLTDEKIKGQMKRINELEKKCSIIRNNIENEKTKKEKENHHTEENQNIKNEREKEILNKYEEEHKSLTQQEKDSKLIIKEQNGIINELKSDIFSMNNDVNEMDKNIKEIQYKINNIQYKINKKKLDHNKNITKNINNNIVINLYNSTKNANVNNANYQMKIRNDDNGRNFKEDLFGLKSNKSNLNNLNVQLDVIKMRKIKKPFENNINFNNIKSNKEENINIINTNKNANLKIKNNDNEINKPKKLEILEKNETYTQIKQLQNDIEEILTTNVFDINKNDKKDNNNVNNNEDIDKKNIQEKINEEICEEKIKDVIPENKFTNYYEDND